MSCQNTQLGEKNSSTRKTNQRYKSINSSLRMSESRTKPIGFWQYQPSSVALAIKEVKSKKDKNIEMFKGWY